MAAQVSQSVEDAPLVEDHDVVVVGAGMGGIYALHRFRSQGLKVLGLEGAAGVGGVWFHNRYPGARVDVTSTEYCYFFSPEIYREWTWSEHYATQPEILRYLNFVADRLEVKPLILFETWLTAARWRPDLARWTLETSTGRRFTARFLVMATGNLSIPRKPAFEGLDDFTGEWVQTSRWPDREVAVAGRRIAVIGIGATAIQAIPVLAEQAEHLYVFQRRPAYAVPARNRPVDVAVYEDLKSRVAEARQQMRMSRFGSALAVGTSRSLAACSLAERQRMLEQQWAYGGHGMGYIFADQEYSLETNTFVADFVRGKARSIVKDPDLAGRLTAHDYPIGIRRLCLDTGYYQTFNRSNVTLVDARSDPIERITRTGIATRDGHFEVDLIVFAIGFENFTGSLDNVDIRNDKGARPTDHWNRGPKTMFGMSTAGFPNFFFLCGPGGPSVLANFFLLNEHDVDWIADAIAYMDRRGLRTIVPTEEGQAKWTAHVAEVARGSLRAEGTNWMLHRNEDGTSMIIPYIGGINRYVEQAAEAAAAGYEGFALT